MKKETLLDIVFKERVFIYSLVPFFITFSFIGILLESAKYLSKYSSPFFSWYPIYLFIIIPLSVYTNSSTVRGTRFIRSIIETLVEVVILLILNFILLKGLKFENLGRFIDLDFGISAFAWMVTRIVNGHIVRLTEFPYRVLTSATNSIASNISITEVLDEKFFEKESLKKTKRQTLTTLLLMLLTIGVAFSITPQSPLIIIYSYFFIIASIIFYVNISKIFIIEDSSKKGIPLSNLDFSSEWIKASGIYTVLVVLTASILSIFVYIGASYVSSKINLSIREKINYLISQEETSQEEIEKIRQQLLQGETNQTTTYTQRPKSKPFIIDFGRVIVVTTLILSVIIIIGFFLKEVLKVRKVHIFKFFISVYELFVYLLSKIIEFIRTIIRYIYLFLRRPTILIDKSIEEELLKSMMAQKEELSKEKIEEIETIVKIFLDMLKYTSYVLPYKRSMGIEEYCNSLVNFLPEFSKNLEFISNVVNESRYSNHLLPPNTIEELRQKVNEITSKINLKVRVVENFRGG